VLESKKVWQLIVLLAADSLTYFSKANFLLHYATFFFKLKMQEAASVLCFKENLLSIRFVLKT